MVLVDGQRRHVDVNGAYLKLVGHTADALIGRPIFDLVVGGPLATPSEWVAAVDGRRFNGEAELRRSDGSHVAVQWAVTAEIVTGRRLVLFVALSTSRWGRAFRREEVVQPAPKPLTPREREVVQLVALGHSGRRLPRSSISHTTRFARTYATP